MKGENVLFPFLIEHLSMAWRTGDSLSNTNWFHNGTLIQYLLARLSEKFSLGKKVRSLYSWQKKKKCKAKNHFSPPPRRKLLTSDYFDPMERVAVSGKKLNSLSQVFSHDISIPVFALWVRQCRAGKLPGSMLGYEHSAACLSTLAASPAGTARFFDPCHWGTSSPTLPRCKLTWYLALQQLVHTAEM